MKKELLSSRHLTHRPMLQSLMSFSWLKKNTITEAISSLLIILFIYTALSKLSAYDNFTAQLSKSPFITSYANSIAWSIPTVEILISLLLVIKKSRLFGLYASFFFDELIHRLLNNYVEFQLLHPLFLRRGVAIFIVAPTHSVQFVLYNYCRSGRFIEGK